MSFLLQSRLLACAIASLGLRTTEGPDALASGIPQPPRWRLLHTLRLVTLRLGCSIRDFATKRHGVRRSKERRDPATSLIQTFPTEPQRLDLA